MHTALKKLAAVLPLILIMVFVLTACSGSGSGGGGATTVTITLTEFKVDSSLTTFQTGVPYHFVVTNKGSVAHTLVIMPPMDNPTDAQLKSATLAGIGDAGVPAGATQSFDYTFKDAAPSGKLEFACHLPAHYESGMKAPITVQ